MRGGGGGGGYGQPQQYPEMNPYSGDGYGEPEYHDPNLYQQQQQQYQVPAAGPTRPPRYAGAELE